MKTIKKHINLIKGSIPIKLLFIGSVLLISLLLISSFFYFPAKKYTTITLDKAWSKKDIVPVLVIGSGPAGLSSAMFTARAKFPTLVIAGPLPGGQLSWVHKIENFPAKKRESGPEIVKELEEQAKRFGTSIINDTVTKINLNVWPFSVVTEGGRSFNALALVIATGRIPKRLYIPGSDTYWGRGVGVCTICDAPFHKNQFVGVVGGGDAAVDHALQLAAYAQKVHMLVRESHLDATETAQEYVKNNPKIAIHYNTELKEIKGNDQQVQALVVENNQTKVQTELEAQGVYFAIGWHPNSELVQGAIATDNNGFIKVKCPTQETNKEGVFAAGDVTDPVYGKAGVAAGSGIRAGMNAIDYLQDIGVNPSSLKDNASNVFKSVSSNTMLTEINSADELQKFIETHKDVTILLEFYGEYCPTCKALVSVLLDIQKSAPSKTVAAKIDIAKSPELVRKFEVKSTPYFIVIKNGKKVNTSSSARSKKELLKLLE